MTGSKGLWVLLAAALVGAGAGPFVFPGPPAEALANRERIAGLSPLERERLDQKLKAYEAMTPEQRESLKKLHRDLADDVVQSKGLSTGVMTDYIAWIGTVPAYRREEILQKTDPGQRINEIREVLSERHSRTVEGPGGEPGGPGLLTRLSGSEMAKVMQILERHVRDSLGQEEQAEFDKLSEAFRQAEAAAIFSEKLGSGPAPQGIGPLLNEIATTLDRPVLRDAMRQPQDGLKWIVYGVNRAMLTTAERNLKRELANRRVGDSALEAYFKQLPADQQDALTNLSADDFRSDLRMRYLGQETAVVTRLEGELRRMRQMQGGGGPFNPGGFRPGRNDQPPPPPPPRDREGGRPQDFGRDNRDDRRPPPGERDDRRPPPEERGDRGDKEKGDRPRPRADS